MTEEEVRIRLGSYIAACRKESEMSLRELEAATGTSRGRLSEIENGRALAKPDTLSRIADALGVDWEDLFALAGYPRPGLPNFGPYLRSKYGDQLSADGLAKLEQAFRDITADGNPEAK